MGGAGSFSSGEALTTLSIGPENASSLVGGRPLFRGSDTVPEVVTERPGFVRTGSRLPGESDAQWVARHVDFKANLPGQADDGLVGTTSNPAFAAKYYDWVYVFKNQKTALDANLLGVGIKSESEFDVPGCVPLEDIYGWRYAGKSGSFSGPFYKNPAFRP
jgi:hypothetical protein